MKARAFVLSVMVLTSVLTFAQAKAAKTSLSDLSFLFGDWTGEGTGTPGNGAGEFSFAYDLQNQVAVRKSFAEYPATKDSPASRHDDLMIVYREPAQDILRAIYFDSEG